MEREDVQDWLRALGGLGEDKCVGLPYPLLKALLKEVPKFRAAMEALVQRLHEMGVWRASESTRYSKVITRATVVDLGLSQFTPARRSTRAPAPSSGAALAVWRTASLRMFSA